MFVEINVPSLSKMLWINMVLWQQIVLTVLQVTTSFPAVNEIWTRRALFPCTRVTLNNQEPTSIIAATTIVVLDEKSSFETRISENKKYQWNRMIRKDYLFDSYTLIWFVFTLGFHSNWRPSVCWDRRMTCTESWYSQTSCSCLQPRGHQTPCRRSLYHFCRNQHGPTKTVK